MNLIQLKRLVDRRPFRPLELELVSGTRIQVRHPEEIGFALEFMAAVRMKDGSCVAFSDSDIAAVHWRKNGRKG